MDSSPACPVLYLSSLSSEWVHSLICPLFSKPLRERTSSHSDLSDNLSLISESRICEGFLCLRSSGCQLTCDLHQHFTNSCTHSTARCTSAARGTCGWKKKTHLKNIFPHIESTVTHHHVWQLRISKLVVNEWAEKLEQWLNQSNGLKVEMVNEQ